MLEAVLWDNDGVLVDTEGLFYEACRAIFLERGAELSLEDFAEWSLRQGRSVFEWLEDCDASEREQLREERNRRYEALIEGGVRVFDRVEESLAVLHGRIPMAIVTSSYPEAFETIHARTGLLRYFEFALKSGDYEHHKPHPEPYLRAAERLGVSPEACLVIEDTERGLEAALRAGMRCAAIPNHLALGGDFSAAHHILRDVGEVPDVVDSLLARR